ncbi:MAG: sensor histidine kinase [Jatrophihabitans sp.]|uniref:sensor histidine kinase n=1 Tax=Jatrophihabitans sp. TaxID=1932789 RepID=UPI003F81BBCF
MVSAEARPMRGVPARMSAFLVLVLAAAVAAPVLMRHLGPSTGLPTVWLTILVLVAVSVLNVEIGRALTGGLERSQQPHKALSAWAFTSALLLSPLALLLIVPLTYAHAWWRGLRVVLWKWIGSAAYLVLAGLGAAAVRHAIMHGQGNLMTGDGGRGFVTLLAAAATFLAIETLLFTGSATLNRASDEVWLRRTLTSASFYLTEAGVLLVGGLLAGVWGAGPWFVLLLAPIYLLLQRAALHEPMRERAAAAAALAAKNDELERANQFKVDLMGMLGHEIGNPLTSIRGFAELGAQALDEGDEAMARDAFRYVERSAQQVQQVRSEILEMVRSERGALTAHPEPCELLPVLEHAIASQPIGSRPLLDCPPGLTAIVQPSHLDQIVTNLLSNATKYGGGATCVRAQAVAGGVEVSVEDAGPGVPPQFRHLLFERFSRDGSTSRQQLGTGLGLFITRELARANHASIRHRDNDPHGAIFTLTLPAA